MVFNSCLQDSCEFKIKLRDGRRAEVQVSGLVAREDEGDGLGVDDLEINVYVDDGETEVFKPNLEVGEWAELEAVAVEQLVGHVVDLKWGVYLD